MSVPIHTLAPGSAFVLECNPNKRGLLLYTGPGAAVVQYGQRERHVTLKDGTEFDAAVSRATTISLNTQVTPCATLAEADSPASAPTARGTSRSRSVSTTPRTKPATATVSRARASTTRSPSRAARGTASPKTSDARSAKRGKKTGRTPSRRKPSRI